ncbi:hypothetical protein [Actinoallomurus vinaceus]|uniref:hypothetical protein n=1 Tax=Actinoallomurus vinaceus TaxID=1080074 RepID=UPI0031F17E94
MRTAMWSRSVAAGVVPYRSRSPAAGGHPPLIVLRADGRLETCELRGPISGCLEGAVYDNAHRDGTRFGDEWLEAFLAD